MSLWFIFVIIYILFEMQNVFISTCAMHQEDNKSRHQKGLCMRFKKCFGHAFQAKLTLALIKENVRRGALL